MFLLLITLRYSVFFLVSFCNKNPAYAVKLFDKILETYPSSPRSIYGKALALDRLGHHRKSNEILYKAIQEYTKLLKKAVDVPNALYSDAVEKTIKIMRFVGSRMYLQHLIIKITAQSRFFAKCA